MACRAWTAAALVAIAIIIVSAQTALACGNCSPLMKSGWSTFRYSVFLDGSLTQQERNAAINGINMWNQWFVSQGQSAPFVLVTYGPGSLTVQHDPSLGTDPAGIDTTYHFIYLNPMYDTRTDGFLTDIMGHEFGHALGFSDQNDAFCYPYTIMHGGISPSSGNYLSGLGSADGCSLSQNFPTPPPPPPPPGQETAQDPCEPLVLDLDGGGIQTTGIGQPVWFDIDADGVKDHIAWTDPISMTAFLWIDLNHNGKVDDGRELFGVGTVLPDGTRARDGFQALAAYDDPQNGGNGDGVISAADSIWNELRLWIDKDPNGVSEGGEVGPIAQFGIDAISLCAVVAHVTDSAGNVHELQGMYSRSGGRDHGPGKPAKTFFPIDALTFQRVP
jgi:hypothetical protein